MDIVAPEHNAWTLRMHQDRRSHMDFLHHQVEVFDGATLKEHADKSFDSVLFVSVLHHAAHNSPGLLLEAARVARKYVIIVEDLGTRQTKYRNLRHDKKGVFRNASEWRALLTASEEDKFEMVSESPLGDPREGCFIVTRAKPGQEGLIGQFTEDPEGFMSKNLGSPGCRAAFQRTFVAQRTYV